MSANKRPHWDEYFLAMARLASKRSTCPRRRVGAVLVKEHRVLATGYNGSVRGAPHCLDVGCLLVTKEGRQSCARAVHAELNAILQCALNGVSSNGAVLYCTDFPCSDCAKALVQAGVKRVVYLADYPDKNSSLILNEAGITLEKAAEPQLLDN
ncbi:MAG TPA: cytidine deaminase [Firmicutes bacterium]|nr:cytidine deaminase [Bacillota bacterium]